jgi:glutamate/tyrosine decarboxylase-like PLP-dependent enzyme
MRDIVTENQNTNQGFPENMLKKLAELERLSRQLDPGTEVRKNLLKLAGNYSESFLGRLPDAKTYTRDVGRAGFNASPIGEDPAQMSDLLEFFRREVDTTGILPASGGQMGYIPGGGLYPSALGDFLADISNRYSGVAFAGPGAAAMEHFLVNWMCRLVGYPESSAGDLTSGGSLATLSALVTARDACGIDYRTIPNACIYLTAQAHHCIGKALHVAGLKDVQKRTIPMDRCFRMDVAALERTIREDQAQGLKPWLVVASAGTTDTGAVDPVSRVADVAARHGTWFHLDAAYGGFFLLCEEGRECLAGVERADSIVMDPHKGLGLPYGTGAVLVKDATKLARSNAYYADYMQDAKQPETAQTADFSPADYSLELTRPFRGPGMWFPLKLFGLKPFRASLAEKIWLARYFHRELGELEGFEAGPFPDLSIVTFRYIPADGDADNANRRLLQAVHEDGKVFITSTRIEGRFTLRLAVLNFRTHRETIDYLLDLLRNVTRHWPQ